LNSRDAILQKTILYLKFGDSGNAKKINKKIANNNSDPWHKLHPDFCKIFISRNA
jgi:hypothetical protein